MVIISKYCDKKIPVQVYLLIMKNNIVNVLVKKQDFFQGLKTELQNPLRMMVFIAYKMNIKDAALLKNKT